MTSRPVVQVFTAETGDQVKVVPLPGVFCTPIRPDVVHFVHSNVAKNKRQAYAVNVKAGHDTSAESWGTGRAVARIPRVNGSGTHRAGQGAFGNMCRKGRMFAPTKTWRKWHRKVSVNQRRYAVASALAASAITPLVLARGHRVSRIAEIPLVLSDSFESVTKTAEALKILNRVGAEEDIDRVRDSRKLRRGRGKMRDRRYVQSRGPLVVYGNDSGLVKAVRNIPGVDTCSVERLNILQLAPGGHLGRFIIWTQSAFDRLDKIWGTPRIPSAEKKDYRLPRRIMTNADLNRIINSDEVQSVVRPAQSSGKYSAIRKKNPLGNFGVMVKLNPHAKAARRAEILKQNSRSARKVAKDKARKKDRRRNGLAFHAAMTSNE